MKDNKPPIKVRPLYGPQIHLQGDNFSDKTGFWKSGVYFNKASVPVEIWIYSDSKKKMIETNLSAIVAGRRYERKYNIIYTNRGLMKKCAQLINDVFKELKNN